jgi:hypothetical protein
MKRAEARLVPEACRTRSIRQKLLGHIIPVDIRF